MKAGQVIADRAAKYPGTWKAIGVGLGTVVISAFGGLGIEGLHQIVTFLRHIFFGN